MPRQIILLALIGLGVISSYSALAAGKPANKDIRLVLQITVDGLRYDLVERYGDRFGKGGFRYLLDAGTVYANAHYQHANTETIVGHATLATGAFPADHGMTGNAWYDRESGELAYNIEDPAHLPLPTREHERAGEQVDPAQQLARTKGRSPKALLAETVADRLVAHTGQQAKVISVSGKDRGAVSMGGQAGKAFWYSTDSGDFVTSSYYYDAYPDWAMAWNDQRQAESLAGAQWQLLNKPSSYLLAHQDDRAYETDLKGFGRVFPHRFAAAGNPLLPTQVLVSPNGDRLTLDFAKAAVRGEELGADTKPDYLGISFSGVDAVNHFFGPSSLENEDMVLQLDRTLQDLFAFIDKRVGLQHTLVVLSADHGMADMPEYMAEQGMATGRLYPEHVIETANAIAAEQLGVEEAVRFYFRPYLYLDAENIVAAGQDLARARNTIAMSLSEHEGIRLAASRELIQGSTSGPLLEQLRRNFHPQRSGDIYVAQHPYWFHFSRGPVAAMHGSPWRYDTHVPIIFAGAGIGNSKIYRLVHPVDVAPTIAAMLGMGAPASARGTILSEVLDNH